MSSGIYNTAKARQEPLQQRLLSRVSSPGRMLAAVSASRAPFHAAWAEQGWKLGSPLRA
jgi:hypothetical protein